MEETVSEGNEVEKEPESLRETIENSIEQVEAQESEAQNSEENVSAQRERDETGRFTKASKEKDLGQADQEQESIEPPHFWDAAKKEQFKTLPRDIQQVIVEQDLNGQRYQTQLQQQLAQERKALAAQAEEMAPLIQARQELQQNPRLALLQLASTLNVDPSELIEYAQQYQSNPMLDSVNQKMQQMEQYLVAQQEAFEGQKIASIESEVQQYANEVDEAGNPSRPYFEALYLEMMPLVAAIRQQNPNASHKQVLDAAYDRAMWGNPHIRQAELERLAKGEEEQRIQAARAKADAARKAGSSISGSPAGTSSGNGSMNLREQLVQAFNEY